jgi:hypothetical protein
MRIKLAGLSLFAALMAPSAMMGIAAAPASAAEGTTCSANSGSIKLSPGLEESARVQNITIKGTLSGCTGTVTTAKYVAQLKTADPVSCSALASPGEVATGSIVIKWSPKGQGNSNGTFSMPLTASAGVSIGGSLEHGPFETLALSGTVAQSFQGTCGGGGKGKKKAKKVKTGSFTGSPVEIS